MSIGNLDQRPAPLLLSRAVESATRGRLRARLDPLRGCGALAAVDVQVAARIAELAGELDPELVLALALAVAAPRDGHLGYLLDGGQLSAARPAGAEPPVAAELLSAPRLGAHELLASSLVDAPEQRSGAPFVLDGALLATARNFELQEQLARDFARRWARLRGQPPELDWLAAGLRALFPGAVAGDRQALAAASALLRPLSVITGGPGTGKTWTVRNILALSLLAVEGAGPALRIGLAAPTGKAARRVEASIRAGLDEAFAESLAAIGGEAAAGRALGALAELPGQTVHRVLGIGRGGAWRPRHDATNPLPYDLVVVDEASMVDLALMARLSAALAPGARLILLGDRHQLASVEAGAVLAELCDAELAALGAGCAREALVAGLGLELPGDEGAGGPVVELTESRRFGADSGLGRLARACIEGRADDLVELLGSEREAQLSWRAPEPGRALPAALEARALEAFGPLVEGAILATGDRAARAEVWRGCLEALTGFRLLCAHRQGEAGAVTVDERCGAALEEAFGCVQRDGPLWLGRPVMVRVNDPSTGLSNGDVGLVVRAADGARRVVFPAPQGGDLMSVAAARLPPFEGAFATTVHKSQGSEFDEVGLVLPPRDSPVLCRELIYTGLTRARARLTLVATRPVLEAALARRVARRTRLAARLGSALRKERAAGAR